MNNEIEKLSDDITKFMFDFDTYEFNNNYNSYEEAYEEVKNLLSSKEETENIINNMLYINDDLKGDNDPLIKELYNRNRILIDRLREHRISLNDYDL
jgi:hypothetical protein